MTLGLRNPKTFDDESHWWWSCEPYIVKIDNNKNIFCTVVVIIEAIPYDDDSSPNIKHKNKTSGGHANTHDKSLRVSATDTTKGNFGKRADELFFLCGIGWILKNPVGGGFN